jgi:hypothetical protein
MDSLASAIQRSLGNAGSAADGAADLSSQPIPMGPMTDSLKGAGAAYHDFMHGKGSKAPRPELQ